jgi:hypothetical protein
LMIKIYFLLGPVVIRLLIGSNLFICLINSLNIPTLFHGLDFPLSEFRSKLH